MSTSGNDDPREPLSGGSDEDAAFEAAWREIVAGFGATAPSPAPAQDPVAEALNAEIDFWPAAGSTASEPEPRESAPGRPSADADEVDPYLLEGPTDDALLADFDELLPSDGQRLVPGLPAPDPADISPDDPYADLFESQVSADRDMLDDPALHRRDPLPAWSPEPADVEEDTSHTFVPPTPPLPRSTPERWLAWITLLGVPCVVVACTVLSYRPTEMVTWFLGLGWLGSFAYLVSTMGEEPRDPWDDGSRV